MLIVEKPDGRSAKTVVHLRRSELPASSGLVPALAAATLAIIGLGSLYLLNSGETPQALPEADETVGYSVIESPSSNRAPSLLFETDGVHRNLRHRILVKPGDSLIKLSETYLGSKEEVWRLIKANPQLANVDLITPGEVLELPDTADASSDRATGSIQK